LFSFGALSFYAGEHSAGRIIIMTIFIPKIARHNRASFNTAIVKPNAPKAMENAVGRGLIIL
jgi:hypothetical protein